MFTLKKHRSFSMAPKKLDQVEMTRAEGLLQISHRTSPSEETTGQDIHMLTNPPLLVRDFAARTFVDIIMLGGKASIIEVTPEYRLHLLCEDARRLANQTLAEGEFYWTTDLILIAHGKTLFQTARINMHPATGYIYPYHQHSLLYDFITEMKPRRENTLTINLLMQPWARKRNIKCCICQLDWKQDGPWRHAQAINCWLCLTCFSGCPPHFDVFNTQLGIPDARNLH